MGLSTNGELKFSWKKDDQGEFVIPEKLKKYVGSTKKLEVVRVLSSDNPEDNDILF